MNDLLQGMRVRVREQSSGLHHARLVSFEGIDGCGKSTLMAQLSQWLEEAQIPHIRAREPGGTVLGEQLRQLLLDPSHQTMSLPAEVLLYTAGRAQLAFEVIRPALLQGRWVLMDRYIDSTLAYQGYGRGLDPVFLRRIQEWATGGLWPHHTLLVDCDTGVALSRMQTRNHGPDRIEQEGLSFQQKVRAGYLELAAAEPNRFVVLDGSKGLGEVVEELRTRFWEPLMGTGPGSALNAANDFSY